MVAGYKEYDLVHVKFIVNIMFVILITTDMERAITRDLVSHILLFSDHLLKAVNFAAELDW